MSERTEQTKKQARAKFLNKRRPADLFFNTIPQKSVGMCVASVTSNRHRSKYPMEILCCNLTTLILIQGTQAPNVLVYKISDNQNPILLKDTNFVRTLWHHSPRKFPTKTLQNKEREKRAADSMLCLH